MAAETVDIVEETIKLTAADGFSLEAFRATPKSGRKGGLVVLQEIFGLTDQLKGVVRAYARDGYDTIFPCLYDRVAPGTVVPFSDPNRGRDMAYGLDLEKVMLDIAAVVERVQNDHGVSILGFCWGGGVIVRAAAEFDLRGAIAFYGTRLPTYLDQKPKCPLHVPLRRDRSQFDAGNHRAGAQGVSIGRNPYLRGRSCLRQRSAADLCRSGGQDGAQPHARLPEQAPSSRRLTAAGSPFSALRRRVRAPDRRP